MPDFRPFRCVRGLAVAMAGLALVSGMSACGHQSRPVPARIVVSSGRTLLSDAVGVTIEGVKPGAVVTVDASAKDGAGVPWASSARYTASRAGTVSLAQASSGGSYTGVNAMGLFEFMAPGAETSETAFESWSAGYTVALQAVVAGKTVATGQVVRLGSTAAGVTRTSYRPARAGVYADMFSPRAGTTGRHPAVLTVGGSEGGLDANAALAGQLAAHGYPTLDLAYFAEPGLPAHLEKIPLEYFAKALTLLRRQPGVDPHHVLVLGGSRGGELALLLGATYPTLIDGVVAAVPSSRVYVGYPDSSEPAWTLHGRAVPAATIAVEKIRGPVLVTCGGQDDVWPSCTYTTDITRRLAAKKFGYPVTSLVYPHAGHFGGDFYPHWPITAAELTSPEPTGGTVAATELAWAASTQRLFALLAAQR